MAKKIESTREAAQIVGVTARTINAWIERGALTPPPWTSAYLKKTSGNLLESPYIRGVGSSAEHGTSTAYRAGCSCAECQAWARADMRRRRREKSLEASQPKADALLRLLEDGCSYQEAVEQAGWTHQGVAGRRKLDPPFGIRLDEALNDVRDPALRHGRPHAWRTGCRCADCREYHEASRQR
ncbi:hypothetical protein [Timonella sp. A28]|uniref:hypothetical protein n=1 Tax=Timonella sp. A28 TaxID=3442640 RepID=UPI003EBEF47C